MGQRSWGVAAEEAARVYRDEAAGTWIVEAPSDGSEDPPLQVVFGGPSGRDDAFSFALQRGVTVRFVSEASIPLPGRSPRQENPLALQPAPSG
jgi:hypothetical protein